MNGLNITCGPYRYVWESTINLGKAGRGDCNLSGFYLQNAHILERQQIASALRCVRSADQNMAAYNRPLSLNMCPRDQLFCDKRKFKPWNGTDGKKELTLHSIRFIKGG